MPLILDGSLGETFPSWTTATRPASPAVGQMGYNTTIGQFDAYTSGGWVSVATTTSTSNKITATQMPAGSVIQAVQGTIGTSTSTTSGTFVSTGLTATITPQFSNSRVLVLLSCEMRSDASKWIQVALYRNASVEAYINTGLHYINGSTITTQLNYSYSDNPLTTSATTYTLYFNSQAGGTVSFNVDNVTATMNLLEIRV
jgi:hypothetical protein